jgi:hypothetical protein
MEEMYGRGVTAFENIIEHEWQVNGTPREKFPFYPAFCELCKKFPSGIRYVCRGCYHLPDGYDLCDECYSSRRNEHSPSHEFLRIPSESHCQRLKGTSAIGLETEDK